MEITILDYGMGNLRSVSKAFELAGARVRIADNARAVLSARALVLPGVGAFGKAVATLKENKMLEPLKARTKENRLTLGICLGHQLLFDFSEEHGFFEGLGAISGGVVRFFGNGKIPHMGWNALKLCSRDPLFESVSDGAEVYFVHSYHATTKKEYTIASCEYITEFPAAVKKGNIYGLQFHPEKSGETGLRIVRNFVDIAKTV